MYSVIYSLLRCLIKKANIIIFDDLTAVYTHILLWHHDVFIIKCDDSTLLLVMLGWFFIVVIKINLFCRTGGTAVFSQKFLQSVFPQILYVEILNYYKTTGKRSEFHGCYCCDLNKLNEMPYSAFVPAPTFIYITQNISNCCKKLHLQFFFFKLTVQNKQ